MTFVEAIETARELAKVGESKTPKPMVDFLLKNLKQELISVPGDEDVMALITALPSMSQKELAFLVDIISTDRHN